MRRIVTLLLTLCLLTFLAACDTAEERAEEHYQNALALIEEGDYDRAFIELRNAVQLVAGHQEARHEMARILLEHRKDPQRAYSQYLRIAEQYPDDLLARVQLSNIAFSVGNWEELDRHGRRAVELAPDDPDVINIQLLLDYRDAIQSENASDRRAVAARAETRYNEEPGADILVEIVVDNALRENEMTKALGLLNELTEASPETERYWNQRLAVLLTLGDDAAVEEQLLRLIEMAPDDDQRVANLLQFYLSRGELDKTEEFLRIRADEADANDITRRIDLIQFLRANRSVDAARAEIASAIPDAEDPLPLIIFRSILDFADGSTDQAILDLETALNDAEPSETVDQAKMALAEMLTAVGNDVGARAVVEEVLANNDRQPSALRMKARWQIDEDDPDAAIAGLRLVLDQNANDTAALTLMAEAYSRKGSTDLMQDFLSLAVDASGNAPDESVRYAQLLISEDRFLPAEDILLAALRVSPNNVPVLVTAGELYLRMEDHGRAQQVIDTLRRIDSADAQQAVVQIEAELVNRQSGTDEALQYLEDIARQTNSDTASKVLLLRALLSTGDIDGAVEFAEELFAEQPDDPAVRLVLAATVASSADTDRAIELYQGLIDEFPNQSSLRIQLISLQRRIGEFDTAEATLAQALEDIPGDPNLLWVRASFDEASGDIDSAIAIYDDLYERFNNAGADSVIVANNLASLLATYRDDDESLERAWTIARRFRETEIPAIQDTYGWILHRRGESEEALPYLEAAATAMAEDAIVQFHYAEALLAANQPEAALAKYRDVLDIAGIGDSRVQIVQAQERIIEIETAAASEEGATEATE